MLTDAVEQCLACLRVLRRSAFVEGTRPRRRLHCNVAAFKSTRDHLLGVPRPRDVGETCLIHAEYADEANRNAISRLFDKRTPYILIKDNVDNVLVFFLIMNAFHLYA